MCCINWNLIKTLGHHIFPNDLIHRSATNSHRECKMSFGTFPWLFLARVSVISIKLVFIESNGMFMHVARSHRTPCALRVQCTYCFYLKISLRCAETRHTLFHRKYRGIGLILKEYYIEWTWSHLRSLLFIYWAKFIFFFFCSLLIEIYLYGWYMHSSES